MLVRLSDNAFVRCFDGIGYVTSQLTRRDRVYDESGATFLACLRRTPRSLADVAEYLSRVFAGAPVEALAEDFEEFSRDLERDGLVVLGETPEDLDARDKRFTYADEAPKTSVFYVLGQEGDARLRPSDEVMLRHFREKPRIFGAHVELTDACNERCVHCYQSRGDARHAPTAHVKDILAQLHAHGTVSLTLSGGEPTLHPDLPELLAEARRLDFVINVLTNGARLSDRVLDGLAAANCNMVQVSLYSMDPAVHDAITGVQGSHACTVRTVERLIERNIPAQVSCPVMMENRASYREVSRWCREHKLRVLSDFVLMARADFDTTNLRHRLDLESTRKVIADVLAEDDEYQVMLDRDPRVRSPDFAEQPVCGVCVDNACFAVDGTMYPCSGFRGFELGNVRDASIDELWARSPRALALRDVRNRSFPRCMTCEARDFCIMCLVRNYNESRGDMFAVADHFCQVAFANKELAEVWLEEKARGVS